MNLDDNLMDLHQHDLHLLDLHQHNLHFHLHALGCREQLMKELSESKVTFEAHLQRMLERETELRTQYEKVIDSIEK